MEFKDLIKQLSDRVNKLKSQILTEEATKNAFIMPFIQALGYDVFNPMEVNPEYISDVGIKKGEKIDYAIMKNGSPVILVECKHWAQDLSLHDGQLLRYFHVSKAKFGLLTNGIVYKFYTDLVAANKMDEKPFFEFDITEIRDNQIEELKKFQKSTFDVLSVFGSASELKYITELKKLIHQELNTPSEAIVRQFAKQTYNGIITQKVMDQFTELFKKASSQFLNDMITDRLNVALNKEKEINKATDVPVLTDGGAKVETTADEVESFLIIKAILCKSVDLKRIFYRDSLSYFAILLDDNNRKTICRLYLNSKKRYIALLNEQKQETKFELIEISDIYKYADQLLEAASAMNRASQ